MSRKYASIKGGRWPGGVVPYIIDSSIGKYDISVCILFIINIDVVGLTGST